MVPVDRGRVRKVAGAHIGRAEFRTYATLFWVAKMLVIGYVLVSLQTKGGVAGVRCLAAPVVPDFSSLIEVTLLDATVPEPWALTTFCLCCCPSKSGAGLLKPELEHHRPLVAAGYRGILDAPPFSAMPSD